jgi:hypothetical protein
MLALTAEAPYHAHAPTKNLQQLDRQAANKEHGTNHEWDMY